MAATRLQSAWWWLVLLVPALEMMLVAAFATHWEPRFRAGEASVFLLSRSQVELFGLNLLNLPVVVALSLSLGVWACWERPFRIGSVLSGMGFGLIVALGNIFVAVVGCVIGANYLSF